MSETPKPPMSEVSPRAERELSNPRERVINAFNRSMDRMQREADAVKAKVEREGPGFLTDYDREIVLGYNHAAEGVKRIAGGRDRLSDEVDKDTFPVEVKDRDTGHFYSREEGVPIGGLLKFLANERRRLDEQASQASREMRFDDARGLSDQSHQVSMDSMALSVNSRSTDIGMWNDILNPTVSNETKRAALGKDNHIKHFQKNRVGTEAYLRFIDPQIGTLGGESEKENWLRAEQDIMKDRRELEIPGRDVEDKIYDEAKIGEKASGKVVPIQGDFKLSLPKVDSPQPSRATEMAKLRGEEDEGGVIKVLVPPRDVPDTDKGVIEEVGDISDKGIMDLSEADRGGRGPRMDSFGVLIENPIKRGDEDRGSSDGAIIEGSARDVTDELARKERDDPGRDILDAALAKIGSGRKRVKSFVSRLPKPGLKKALTWLGVAAGAAGVMLAQDNNRGVIPNTTGTGAGISPVEGVVKPGIGPSVWEPESIPPGLTVSESARPNVERGNNSGYKRVEVEIPGQGKRNIDVKILTGNEDYIFNNVERNSEGVENKPSPIGVSGAEVKRAIENPQADDETAKMIRSYLDEGTIKLVKSLPEERYEFKTRGPQGEKLKEDFASFKGAFDARWTEAILGRPFDMRSAEDLAKLQEAKNTPEYKQAWRVVIADRLLQSMDPTDTGNFGIAGYLKGDGEIVDMVVTVPFNHGYRSRDISSLYKGGQP